MTGVIRGHGCPTYVAIATWKVVYSMYQKWSGGDSRNSPLMSLHLHTSHAHLSYFYTILGMDASIHSPRRTTQALSSSAVMALVTDEAPVPLSQKPAWATSYESRSTLYISCSWVVTPWKVVVKWLQAWFSPMARFPDVLLVNSFSRFLMGGMLSLPGI